MCDLLVTYAVAMGIDLTRESTSFLPLSSSFSVFQAEVGNPQLPFNVSRSN